MLLAERAVLGHYKSVGIVLLVLNAVIVSMLAFGTFKSNFGSCRFDCHNKTPYKKITPFCGAYIKFTILKKACQSFLTDFLQLFTDFLTFFFIKKVPKFFLRDFLYHLYTTRTCARVDYSLYSFDNS